MDEIDQLLSRGVDTIYPSREALEKVLRSGKKLRLYQGFDPTGIQLHIGHAVGFRKLAQFQKLGHEVIFLIGDGTGQAGDPSGKKRSREKYLSNEQLRENGKSYVMQSGKIMDFEGKNPVKIMYNGDWLNKLTLVDILDIAGHFTLQQMLERDLYQDRLKNNEPLNLREFMYPLLQGYDSVAMHVDMEIGGADQTFNMLVGRQLVKDYDNKEKFVLTVPLLTDSKGTKIGKTEGNVIGLTDEPNDFYGKIMALGDDAIIPCFTLLTDTSEEEIALMKNEMENGTNPMTFKKKLAHTLTKQFNDRAKADVAQQSFETRFQHGDAGNTELPTHSAPPASTTLVDALTFLTLATSKSEAKRLVEQKAVRVNGILVDDPKHETKLSAGDLVEVGRKAVKIT
jgi:tyrosyl-tRNA synthetase